MNFFEKRCVCVYMCVLLFVISKFEWNYPEIPSGEHFPCFESICFEWISNTGSCIHWGYELCFQIMKKHVWVISITINIIYSIFHHTLSILKRTLYFEEVIPCMVNIMKFSFSLEISKIFLFTLFAVMNSHVNAGVTFWQPVSFTWSVT